MWKVLVAFFVLCTPSTAKDGVDFVAPITVGAGKEGTEVPEKIKEQIFVSIFPAMPKVPLLPKKYWPIIKHLMHMEVDYIYYYDPETKTTTYTTQKQLEELSTLSAPIFGKPSWKSVLIKAAQETAFILFFAFLYKTMVVDKRKDFPPNIEQNGEFRSGLFDCFSNMNLCCLAFCCAPMRAADTFNAIGAMPYWNVIGIFVVVWFITTILPAVIPDQDSMGWATLILAGIFFGYRHVLRKKLGKKDNADMSSQVTDFCAWWCCQCCAIAQEARIVDAASGEEPACPFCAGLKTTGVPLVGNPVAAE